MLSKQLSILLLVVACVIYLSSAAQSFFSHFLAFKVLLPSSRVALLLAPSSALPLLGAVSTFPQFLEASFLALRLLVLNG